MTGEWARTLVLLIAAVASLHAAGPQVSEADAAVQRLYAEAQTAKSKGDVQTAIQKYRAILRLQPRLASAHNNLGLLYFSQQNYREAAQAFEQALRWAPNLASALVLLGLSQYQMGEFAKARTVLEKAVQVKPDDEQALLYLGHALFNLGEQEAGAAAVQKLLRLNPRNAEALYSLGQVYMKLAQASLKRLQEVAPDSHLVDLVLGQAMESADNYEQALAYYKRAAAKKPDFRGVHYHLGNAYWLQGKWQEARAEFEEELARDPYNCLALWKVGNIAMKSSDNAAAALSSIERAVAICPDVAQARLDYGRLLAGRGEYERAIQQFTRVVQLSPEEPSPHFLLSGAYGKLGRTEQAAKELAIFQEMDRKAREAKRVPGAEAAPAPTSRVR